ncbi:MAG: trypsin-like peptidase domain-containing protein [Pirellulaceae bacterium]|nr:trypsin-like peptidase domain-containing protein [Pirellulaceae bacterium]
MTQQRKCACRSEWLLGRTIVQPLIAFVFLIVPALAGGQDQDAARVFFFTMDNCPPCKQMEPIVAELIRQGYPVTKIDARLQPEWTSRFQVTQTPTTIFVQGNREVARQNGIIPAATIQNWLDQNQNRTTTSNQTNANLTANSVPSPSGKRSPTQGTRQPANDHEHVAMQATVRLKIDEGNSFSFGTGTIIHSHDGECLVLTCGHLFRESGQRGVLTADVNWTGDKPITVPAELISYDADANDVALVVIRPGFEILPVKLADSIASVTVGAGVFSIGCDKGEPPTIRHSEIKNHAIYDGAKKYDIVGRPTIGRSGGGLFLNDGTLVGVCNAAAVREDEGIYTALDNIYFQIKKSGLSHLFPQKNLDSPNIRVVDAGASTPRQPAGFGIPQSAPTAVGARPTPDPSPELLALAEDVRQRNEMPNGRRLMPIASQPTGNAPNIRQVSHESYSEPEASPRFSSPADDDYEMIVVIRSKQNPLKAETFVVPNPDPSLLGQLRSRSAEPTPNVDQRFADLRATMPELSRPADTNRAQLRAQSPK